MSSFKDAADTVKGIVESVPIYEDMLQPTAKELGKSGLTIAKTINIALSPLTAFVWGFDKIKDFLQESIEEKLKDVPQEYIITPDPSVAVPAIEALRYTGGKEDLRELFSELIATSMDNRTAHQSHPSYVEVIKQLTSDEAKILRLIKPDISYPVINVRLYNTVQDTHQFANYITNFSLFSYQANCQSPKLGPMYIENLSRLGLINIDYQTYSVHHNAYKELENHPVVIDEAHKVAENNNMSKEIIRGSITLSNYGALFHLACMGNGE